MSIRIAAPATAAALVIFWLAGPAAAQQNVMKECGAQYQTAKSADTLAGKTWNQYLAECRVRVSAQPAATTAAPAAAPAPAPAAANPLKPAPTAATPAPAAPAADAKPVSAGRAAETTRQKACGAEWRAQKVELRKANPALKWPQYWSECNTRMKAAGK